MVATLQRYIGRICTFRGVVSYRLWCPGGLGRAGKLCTVLYSVIQCVESRVMSSTEIHKGREALTRFPYPGGVYKGNG
jgi:hypothetical protein